MGARRAPNRWRRRTEPASWSSTTSIARAYDETGLQGFTSQQGVAWLPDGRRILAPRGGNIVIVDPCHPPGVSRDRPAGSPSGSSAAPHRRRSSPVLPAHQQRVGHRVDDDEVGRFAVRDSQFAGRYEQDWRQWFSCSAWRSASFKARCFGADSVAMKPVSFCLNINVRKSQRIAL